MTRKLVGVLVAVVALAGSPAGSVVAREECSAAQYVDSYDVSAEPRRKAYRIGRVAVVDILVEDSVTGMPAGDVDAGLVILGRGKRSPYGYGTTDAEGRIAVRIVLHPSAVRPGWAHAFVGAGESIVTPAYCTGRYGQREYPRLFRIRP